MKDLARTWNAGQRSVYAGQIERPAESGASLPDSLEVQASDVELLTSL